MFSLPSIMTVRKFSDLSEAVRYCMVLEEYANSFVDLDVTVNFVVNESGNYSVCLSLIKKPG